MKWFIKALQYYADLANGQEEKNFGCFHFSIFSLFKEQ